MKKVLCGLVIALMMTGSAYAVNNNLGVKCSSNNLNYASISPCMYNPKCGCYR